MSIDMTPAISAIATEVVSVERPSSSGSYVNGTWAPAGTTTFEILASVTPSGFRDIQRLAEGEQTKEAISVFSSAELKTESQGQLADVLTWNGTRYQVGSVRNYGSFGFYHAIATKVSAV